MSVPNKEDYYLKIIVEAFFALNGSRSPSNSKERQTKELARCFDLLSSVVRGKDGDL